MNTETGFAPCNHAVKQELCFDTNVHTLNNGDA